jgi:hypothetical protein
MVGTACATERMSIRLFPAPLNPRVRLARMMRQLQSTRFAKGEGAELANDISQSRLSSRAFGGRLRRNRF